MPRNGSGSYTLPIGPFTPGTVISSSDVNSDFSDIASALTGSLAADGQTQITGQLKSGAGANPSYTFAGDTNTGFGSSGPDVAYVAAGGVQTIVATATAVSITGTLTTSGALTVTAGGLTITADGATITGTTAITGDATVTGIFTVVSTSHEVLPTGTTAQRPVSLAAAQFRFNSTIGWIEFYDGTIWRAPGRLAPTKQYLSGGAGATYTTPAGCTGIHVEFVGGGGGGGASATNSGGAGGATTFNGISANGGSGGGNGSAGSGGSGGAGAASLRRAGGGGAPGYAPGAGTAGGGLGGSGGSNPFGGAGSGAPPGQGGGGAVANTGGGGGGGASAVGVGSSGGGGGGSGEYVQLIIPNPAASYIYTIGAGGTAGAAGGQAGGAGGSGFAIVIEYY